MKFFDVPPAWLILCLMLAWLQARYADFALTFGGAWADLAGGLLVGGGLLLIVLAVAEMRRARTTVIPRREAAALVTSGIFSRSRNPIYLGDAMVLAGLILYWDAVLSLPLIPVFVWWIERRFIQQEERWLRRQFRAEFARYEQKVRRWI